MQTRWAASSRRVKLQTTTFIVYIRHNYQTLALLHYFTPKVSKTPRAVDASGLVFALAQYVPRATGYAAAAGYFARARRDRNPAGTVQHLSPIMHLDARVASCRYWKLTATLLRKTSRYLSSAGSQPLPWARTVSRLQASFAWSSVVDTSLTS